MERIFLILIFVLFFVLFFVFFFASFFILLSFLFLKSYDILSYLGPSVECQIFSVFKKLTNRMTWKNKNTKSYYSWAHWSWTIKWHWDNDKDKQDIRQSRVRLCLCLCLFLQSKVIQIDKIEKWMIQNVLNWEKWIESEMNIILNDDDDGLYRD